MKEAMFYDKKDGTTQCRLCPHECVVSEGKTGICGVRKNIKGKLYSLVYGKLCSTNIDPIEKKPLFHFAPGTECLSIATVGCNLSCAFCQNFEISHPPSGGILGIDITPEKVVEAATNRELPGIAYTYTEPTIAWEFYHEIMKLAKKAGLYNVWISNGYISPEPARKIAKLMDAVNVDLKGDIGFYRKLCGVPNEEPMHTALRIYKDAGVWIEVTNLVIPGHNDRPEQARKLAEWVKENLGPDTPMHFSRFYPQYKLDDIQPTPVKTVEAAAKAAQNAGLRWAYVGNVPGNGMEDTVCPECGDVLIKRAGMSMASFKQSCERCKVDVPIAGKEWMK
ncbi:MAG: AmmeMemoRadiSam system radical SAM enzyme [Candidatus Aenigmatarchaeota archaeon]|nr:MAG: AmmeMemoRadiSam system radical SAM enzyme [Candidatus Aenigmarchaeota archaeon]